MGYVYCKGPPVGFVNAGSKKLEAFDIGLSRSSGFGTASVCDDFQRKHGIPDFEFDDFGISRLTPSRNFRRGTMILSMTKNQKVPNNLMTLMARTSLMRKQLCVTACSSWRSKNVLG